MRLIRTLALASLAALAAACHVVTSAEPLGTRPVAVDASGWDGVWLYADGTIHLKVTDPEAGRLTMVTIDDTDEGLETVTLGVQLLAHDGWTFANLTPEEEPDTNYWVRVDRKERQLIAWLPSPVLFAAAVEAGQLPGRVDEQGNVHLPALTAEQLELITDSTHGILIDWEQPIAFIRVTDEPGL